jgi:hypothetical protein
VRIYEVAGVTVTIMKLEQSAEREVTSGILPVRVPLTALAQLSATHSKRRGRLESRPEPASRIALSSWTIQSAYNFVKCRPA